mmetsp:Transcript_2338/g.6221  ORF Transcript_2338/g.6221 Transcript_2338/m.6221 type:complete len:679 (+) Transcript_2338:693-2729(+)
MRAIDPYLHQCVGHQVFPPRRVLSWKHDICVNKSRWRDRTDDSRAGPNVEPSPDRPGPRRVLWLHISHPGAPLCQVHDVHHGVWPAHRYDPLHALHVGQERQDRGVRHGVQDHGLEHLDARQRVRRHEDPRRHLDGLRLRHHPHHRHLRLRRHPLHHAPAAHHRHHRDPGGRQEHGRDPHAAAAAAHHLPRPGPALRLGGLHRHLPPQRGRVRPQDGQVRLLGRHVQQGHAVGQHQRHPAHRHRPPHHPAHLHAPHHHYRGLRAAALPHAHLGGLPRGRLHGLPGRHGRRLRRLRAAQVAVPGRGGPGVEPGNGGVGRAGGHAGPHAAALPGGMARLAQLLGEPLLGAGRGGGVGVAGQRHVVGGAFGQRDEQPARHVVAGGVAVVQPLRRHGQGHDRAGAAAQGRAGGGPAVGRQRAALVELPGGRDDVALGAARDARRHHLQLLRHLPPLHVPVDQHLPVLVGLLRDVRRGGGVVLGRRQAQPGPQPAAQVRLALRALQRGHRGLRLLPHRRGAAHPHPLQLLREAMRAVQEQPRGEGHGVHGQLLPVVPREVHRLHQPQRLHRVGDARARLLHVGVEGLRAGAAQPATRGRGARHHPGRPARRPPLRLLRHPRPQLHHRPGHGQVDGAGQRGAHPHAHLHRPHGVVRGRRLPGRLRGRRRHRPALLPLRLGASRR